MTRDSEYWIWGELSIVTRDGEILASGFESQADADEWLMATDDERVLEDVWVVPTSTLASVS